MVENSLNREAMTQKFALPLQPDNNVLGRGCFMRIMWFNVNMAIYYLYYIKKRGTRFILINLSQFCVKQNVHINWFTILQSPLKTFEFNKIRRCWKVFLTRKSRIITVSFNWKSKVTIMTITKAALEHYRRHFVFYAMSTVCRL